VTIETQSEPARPIKSRRRLARVFVAGVLSLHLLFFINLRERIQRGYPDFTVFFTAATILRDGLGHQLYDEQVQYEVQKKFAGQISSRRGPLPYIHPPFEALIFFPVTSLPYPQAFVLWDLLNLAMLFGVGWLLRQCVNTLRAIPPWEFVAGTLALFPVFACFLQGQDSILQLLLCTLGFHALKKDSKFVAGCWFALAMFKFQLMIPVVLLIVIWKGRRVAAGFATACLVLALVSAGLVGWQTLFQYPIQVLHVGQSPGLGAVPPELMPNLRGLFLGWPFFLSKPAGITLTLLSSVLLFVFAAVKGRRAPNNPRHFGLQFSLAIAISGLIGWHTNAHDLCLLVLPLVLMADYSTRELAAEPRRRRALWLPLLPVLVSPFWIALWLRYGQVSVMAIPLLWWTWAIGKELSRSLNSPNAFQVSATSAAL
jgi:hypothetical protein